MNHSFVPQYQRHHNMMVTLSPGYPPHTPQAFEACAKAYESRNTAYANPYARPYNFQTVHPVDPREKEAKKLFDLCNHEDKKPAAKPTQIINNYYQGNVTINNPVKKIKNPYLKKKEVDVENYDEFFTQPAVNHNDFGLPGINTNVEEQGIILEHVKSNERNCKKN